MIPSKNELRSIIEEKKGNIVPVYATMKADLLTPVSAYLKLSKGYDYSFLFESVEKGSNIGRFSFIGANPSEILRTGARFEAGEVDPLKLLEEKLDGIKFVPVQGIPTFSGGAVGYVSYDCVKYFEPRTKRELEDILQIPEAMFMFYDQLIVFDHLFHVIKLVCHLKITEQTLERLDEEYEKLKCKLEKMQTVLESAEAPLPKQPPIKLEEVAWESNVGQSGYEAFVKKLKDFIVDGDIVQAVPSQRITRPTLLHPFNCYRELRSVNPSPYMFYVDCKDFQVVGASPEMMCKVEDRKVFTHPIAGTRKRGKTPEEDEELAKDLLSDEKETAEHVMLVDLGRNDVNRVCDPRTTNVDSYMHIEMYSHVMHLVSQVSGTLRSDKTPFDAFRSIFPAGTVSGAPKVRAIELISECEKEKRGVYAGAVGYFGYSGDLDTAIAIRTLVFKAGKVYLQAGAGIVYDSDPTSEYQETMNKLGSNLTAISRAESFYRT